MDPLIRVQRAATRRIQREAEWRAAIRDARAIGVPLRKIAEAAGITHVRVLHIVRGDPPRDEAYHKAHRAVDKLRGKPKECSRCGTTDPEKVYDWANLTGNFDDPMDYERMCRKCHRAFDRERRLIRS